MWDLILWSVLATSVAGLIIKLILEKKAQYLRITWREYALGMFLITLVVAPGVSWIGWTIARNSNLSFNENWNGWERAAVAEPVSCSRDGPCRHEYDCDPYVVPVTYSCNCDKNGCSTCVRMETRYHSCPYVKVETNYFVRTTLGDYTIDSNRFPNNPNGHRWRERHEIPQSVIDRAGVGEPPFWTAAWNRIAAGKPGPVTARRSYDNYIYASDRSILKQYSANIEEFSAKGLLPAPQSDVFEFYAANKVYAVGVKLKDPARWQKALEYVNASVGRMEGDVHLIVVQNESISQNPDRYANALRAYWQDPVRFGDDVVSKNSIVVIVGTADGQTVSWARAFTGMPLGNEALAILLRDRLVGVELSPDSLLGVPESIVKTVTKSTLEVSVGEIPNTAAPGMIEQIVRGDVVKGTYFKRVSMSGKDGSAGFLYLKNEIQLSGKQELGIFITVFVLCMGVWFFFAVHDGESVGRNMYERFRPRRFR